MKDAFRRFQWLIFAAVFYVIALNVAMPQMQTLCWKLGNVTVASFVGYWIDRHLFRSRLDEWSHAPAQIRRAIIVAAAMISEALGL